MCHSDARVRERSSSFLSVSDVEDAMVKMNLKIVYDGVGAGASCFRQSGAISGIAMTIVIGYFD